MTVDKFVQMCRLYMDIMNAETVDKSRLAEFEGLYAEATLFDRLEFAKFIREFRRTRKGDLI